MKKRLLIHHDCIEIPAILWGNSLDRLIIAVHGDMSNKEDKVIELLAESAISKNYSVLSFDLPEHGDRKNNHDYECNPSHCVSDLRAVYSYVSALSAEIDLFACSIGVYFSLLALHGSSIRKALFLSPVVNMERIIQVMMTGFGVTQERLEREQKIPLPIGKILDWSYYTYVKQHPVNFSWNSSIAILYGSRDALSPREEIEAFSHQYKATFTLLVDGEHYFASDRQLYFYKEWLGLNL